MKRLKHLSVLTLGLYLAIVGILIGASFVVVNSETQSLLRTIVGITLLPTPFLLLIPLLLRNRVLIAIFLILNIGWMVIYGPFLLPRNTIYSINGERISVLTFNLKAAERDLELIADTIRNADADLVALQELSHSAADYLSETFADLYSYQALHPQQNAFQGQGVMSKFPIVSDDYWRYEQLPASLAHMVSEIQMEHQQITFYSVHPMPPVSFARGFTIQSHSREIKMLLDRVKKEQQPVLLAGDFNMTHLGDEYRQVSALYTDTFREAGKPGFGFTFPAGHKIPLPPILRLDYVFHSTHFTGTNAYPLAHSGTSDHLPVWAELVLRAE